MAVPPRGAAAAAHYKDAAAELRGFLETFDRLPDGGEKRAADQIAALLSRFEDRLSGGEVPPPSVKPARYGLALLADHSVRRIDGLRLSAWSAAAHTALFEGRDMSINAVRGFQQTAERTGPEYAGLAAFLDGILQELTTQRTAAPRRTSGGWGRMVLASVVALVLALCFYALFLEARYQQRLIAEWEQGAGLLRTGGGDLASRLDGLAEGTAQVDRAASLGPLKGRVALPVFNAASLARAGYRDTVGAELPQAIALALDEALATEGENLQQYDTLRAWSVLDGTTGWQPAYLSGWMRDRDVHPLAGHVAALAGATELRSSDPELMTQARGFASETSDAERAWLELLRSDGVAELEPWVPTDAVPEIDRILVRRSGQDVSTPMPGLFTSDGWSYARDFGAGSAVQRARAVSATLLASPPREQNDAPDQVMDLLQEATITEWSDWLADLRVRPFTDRQGAVLVSGVLSQRNNPLELLLREVWVQVGGADRTRSHRLQLRLATVFGPMIQYVEQGRMQEIARLFSTLNVALSTFDQDVDRGNDRLMSVQDMAASAAALRTAPRVVVQITEDVLAQASATGAGDALSALTRVWQRDVFPACRGVLGAGLPFGSAGGSAPVEFERLFAPAGLFDRFFQRNLADAIDIDADPWRWKPGVRLRGLTPESAEFFQKVALVRAAYFGASQVPGAGFTVSALAERGETLLAVGGDSSPVRASGAPERLSWPGPNPALGAEVSFRDGGASSRLAEPGMWGMISLLDRFRLRARDGGKRMLVDIRSETGRVFVEMVFDSEINPLSTRGIVKEMVCPPTL